MPNLRPTASMLSRIAKSAAVVLFLAHSACRGQAVPDSKIDYVGEWTGPQTRLAISRDGWVSFERANGRGNLPLRSLADDAVVVGFFPFRRSFRIDRPPHREGEEWKMTVDGVELRRLTLAQTAESHHQDWERECEAGRASSCANLAVPYLSAGATRDLAKAAALLEKACDGDHLPSCANLGRLHVAGDGVARDPARAVQLFKRGCDAGHASSCTDLGVQYEQGNGVETDLAAAIRCYEQGCTGGNALGCYFLGMNYETGVGVAKDLARAVALYTTGCEGGAAESCTNLGVLNETGNGVPRDPARAGTLYRKGCEGGNPLGCQHQARLQSQ
jgi:hypothetical protein